MSLTITVQVGSTFKVGDLEVSVVSAHSASDFTVKADGKLFDIDEDKWTVIQDGIQLRAPYPQQGQRNRTRVQVDAPGFYVTRDRK